MTNIQLLLHWVLTFYPSYGKEKERPLLCFVVLLYIHPQSGGVDADKGLAIITYEQQLQVIDGTKYCLAHEEWACSQRVK